jgi:2'-hydroxyisoflavone reductase
MRILILGGTGFLGPHLVDQALAKGWEVTTFNRGKTDPARLAGDKYKSVHQRRPEGARGSRRADEEGRPQV